MGFWKDVALDISLGMSKEEAIALNAKLRYSNLSKEERDKLIAIAEANKKIDTME